MLKKQILFIWFGESEPSYAEWSISNFKAMNPSWNIKYVKYTTSQILEHHKELNDPILEEAIHKLNNEYKDMFKPGTRDCASMGKLGNYYKAIYLEGNRDHCDIQVYFDLDCFPIAPLDDFFIPAPSWYSKKKEQLNNKYIGTWVWGQKAISGKYARGDMLDCWFFYKSKEYVALKQNCLQILKDVRLNENVGYVDESKQFIVNIKDNSSQIQKIKDHIARFLDMKLKPGEGICNPFFTPVEHMQISERYKLKNNDLAEQIK